MKKLNYLLAMLALCVLYGCSEDDTTSLSVVQNTVTFPYKGGVQTITISSNGQWAISQIPEWLFVSAVNGMGDGEVVLTAEANPNNDNRQGQLVIYSTDGGSQQVIAIQQVGTHASLIQVSSAEEKVFGGRAKIDYTAKELEAVGDFVGVTSDTEWEIDAPSWTTISFSGETTVRNGKTVCVGSGKLYLMMNETYIGEDSRRAIVRLKTVSGESEASFPICQLGKDEVFGYNRFDCVSGYACIYKVGANVEYIMSLLVEGKMEATSLTYEHINKYGVAINAGYDGDYTPVQFLDTTMQPDKDYTIFTIGVDANKYFAPLSKVYKYEFRSITKAELRPSVEIKDVKYENGKLQWTVCPNDYTLFYETSLIELASVRDFTYNYLSLYYGWMYKNYGGYFQSSDIEQVFSFEMELNEDIVILAIPHGATNKTSATAVYVTDFFN